MPDYTTISNNKSTSKGCFLLCIRCANLTLICYHRLLFLLASLLARVKKYAPQITVRHFFEV